MSKIEDDVETKQLEMTLSSTTPIDVTMTTIITEDLFIPTTESREGFEGRDSTST